MFIHLFLWPFSGTCVLRPPRLAIIYGTTAAFYLSFTTISHLRTSLEPKGQLYGFFTAVQLFPIFPLLLSHFFSTSFPSLILLFAFFTLNLVLFFFPFVFSSYFTFFHLCIFTVWDVFAILTTPCSQYYFSYHYNLHMSRQCIYNTFTTKHFRLSLKWMHLRTHYVHYTCWKDLWAFCIYVFIMVRLLSDNRRIFLQISSTLSTI